MSLGLLSHVVFAISVENVLPTPIYRWKNVARRVFHLSEQTSTLRLSEGSDPHLPPPTHSPAGVGTQGKQRTRVRRQRRASAWPSCIRDGNHSGSHCPEYSVPGTSRALSAYEKRFIIPTLQTRKQRHTAGKRLARYCYSALESTAFASLPPLSHFTEVATEAWKSVEEREDGTRSSDLGEEARSQGAQLERSGSGALAVR